jgi:hypothetical protein
METCGWGSAARWALNENQLVTLARVGDATAGVVEDVVGRAKMGEEGLKPLASSQTPVTHPII